MISAVPVNEAVGLSDRVKFQSRTRQEPEALHLGTRVKFYDFLVHHYAVVMRFVIAPALVASPTLWI